MAKAPGTKPLAGPNGGSGSLPTTGLPPLLPIAGFGLVAVAFAALRRRAS